jgi:D-alanyl-D-alanine-carboxypeptidase/D-alanyl-D-alanine-endopeptidase
MNTRTVKFLICLALLVLAMQMPAAAGDFTEAVHAFLQHRVEVEKKDVGIVVGIVDERGSSIVSFGKMDNGTEQEVNGDTLFEIGSITKTFFGVLLEEMVDRGEMKLDDPVAEYLPSSVKLPTYQASKSPCSNWLRTPRVSPTIQTTSTRNARIIPELIIPLRN